MSTTLKFVKPEHEDILREYLDQDGVILLFSEEAQQKAMDHGYENDDELVDYDFGGNPDMVIEKVSYESHHALNFMSENPKE